MGPEAAGHPRPTGKQKPGPDYKGETPGQKPSLMNGRFFKNIFPVEELKHEHGNFHFPWHSNRAVPDSITAVLLCRHHHSDTPTPHTPTTLFPVLLAYK